jgi:hypothetical protein
MEKILKIKETDFDNFTGFQILTNLQTISIGISNEQQCCENFGCIITNDEIDEFLNSELIEISITDTVLNNKKIKELEYLKYEGEAMFINLETSKGLLQFVAYNEHNGYYGHYDILISNQFFYETFI